MSVWTIKNAECQRNDAFELWYWRRLLRFPWTARISNQSILKEINPEYSLEGLMLKLKLEAPIPQPFDAKSQLTGKDPDAVKNSGQEERGATEDEIVFWHHQLNGHEFDQTPGDIERLGSLECCGPWDCKESDRT